MPPAEILDRLSEIAAEFFDQPHLRLTASTVAADVEGWDSLAHIQFLMQVEDVFKIRFKSSEVSGFDNVGQLADRVQALRGG